MIIRVCSICGNKIPEPGRSVRLETRKCMLEGMRDGYFDVHYNQAVVDEHDDVIHFGYCEGFCICNECQQIANQAIWKAFEPILKNRKKSISVSMSKFPPEPRVEGLGCDCCEDTPF